MTMDLSISIVNWNVKKYLRNCLKSIYDTVNNLNFEVIVVDNNSRDGIARMLKNEFPLVKLIENKRNYGFAAANNQAIKEAKGKYILLLNPDTIVLPGTIEGVVNFMDSHSEVGITSCRKVDQNGNQYLGDLFIGKYNPFSFEFYPALKSSILIHLSNLFPDNKMINKSVFNMLTSVLDFNLCHKNKPAEVDIVWGSFMMIRKELIRQIGTLDERFFFGADDDDFCYRTKMAGWKIYFCPQYKIIHMKKKSLNQWSKKDRIDVKAYSFFMFYRKHKSKIRLFFWGLKIIGMKVIVKGVSLMLDLILMLKGAKIKKEDRDLNSDSAVSADIRNLFRVIFDVSPKFIHQRRLA